MFLKYKIQDYSVNGGKPFEMIIYFEKNDTVNGYWIAPVFVLYNNEIINGTFHLDESRSMNVLDSSVIPNELVPYKNAYFRTLDGLYYFTIKPISLDAKIWYAYGHDISGQLEVNGIEKVTVPAGTFNCTLLGSSSEPTALVNKDLPYPVKGQQRGYVNGTFPIVSSYELEEIGEGYPNVPEFPLALLVLLMALIPIIFLKPRKVSSICINDFR